MNLLINTQSFIWFFEADDKLPLFVRTMMEEPEKQSCRQHSEFLGNYN
jgi:PIN domain nuclease of toxin-antitoxin system